MVTKPVIIVIIIGIGIAGFLLFSLSASNDIIPYDSGATGIPDSKFGVSYFPDCKVRINESDRFGGEMITYQCLDQIIEITVNPNGDKTDQIEKSCYEYYIAIPESFFDIFDCSNDSLETISPNDCPVITNDLTSTIYFEPPPSILVQIHPEIVICSSQIHWVTSAGILYLQESPEQDKVEIGRFTGSIFDRYYFINYQEQMVSVAGTKPIASLLNLLDGN